MLGRARRQLCAGSWHLACCCYSPAAVPVPGQRRRQYGSTSEPPDAEIDHLVIGGGVVGLAIAERLARISDKVTFLVERHGRAGEETSSRNSEVIHGGINRYRPLKQALCVRGRQMLYKLCEEKGIPYQNTQKFVIATSEDQVKELEAMHRHCSSPEVNVETYLLEGKEAMALEPDLYALKVLVSPTTGIVSSHGLMQYFEGSIQEAQSSVIYNTAVTNIQKYEPPASAHIKSRRGSVDNKGPGYIVTCESPLDTVPQKVLAKVIINAAGLGAEKVASLILPPGEYKKQRYAQGSYYDYRGSGVSHVQRLLYPVPEANHAGLGTHLTRDLEGYIRFGPDVKWLGEDEDWHNYLLAPEEERNLELIFHDVRKYLPGISREGLKPSYSGIRPKLSSPGEPSADFWIEHSRTAPGFVNMQGIESPGLTSCLALAEYVGRMVYEYSQLTTQLGDVEKLDDWA